MRDAKSIRGWREGEAVAVLSYISCLPLVVCRGLAQFGVILAFELGGGSFLPFLHPEENFLSVFRIRDFRGGRFTSDDAPFSSHYLVLGKGRKGFSVHAFLLALLLFIVDRYLLLRTLPFLTNEKCLRELLLLLPNLLQFVVVFRHVLCIVLVVLLSAFSRWQSMMNFYFINSGQS